MVLLFVNARQTLILSEATQQVEDQNPLAMGRPACAVIPQVMNSGRAALSLGCCGARAYLDVLTDDVALFAIPGKKAEAYARRIEELATANDVLSKFHEIRRRDIEAGGAPRRSRIRSPLSRASLQRSPTPSASKNVGCPIQARFWLEWDSQTSGGEACPGREILLVPLVPLKPNPGLNGAPNSF